MCGIAGWFSDSPLGQNDTPRLDAMITALRHRGPDGRGALVADHAALGHTRLAIIDLAGGTQPMTSTDGHASIVFNGEIYNYIELRRQLKGAGVDFRTASDTEVILQLFQLEGIAGFGRLRGMYAFALWDRRTRTGYLVRDPVGIKPLFTRAGGGGELIFASEAKSILARDRSNGELDTTGLHLLMNFRYIPGNGTLFRDIDQVAPGTVVVWQPGNRPRRHRIESVHTEVRRPTLDALRDSVHAHLTADVEVGAYLSGGIDSAAIVSLAHHENRRFRTFTLDVGDDPREAENAARTAQLLGVENIRAAVPENLDEVIPRLIHHLELPKINALQVSQIAKLAARHVKVVLSGLGGDELFAGYNAHRLLHIADRVHAWLPRPVTRGLGSAGIAISRMLSSHPWSEVERAQHMLNDLGNWPRVYGLLRNVWDHPTLRRRIYGPRLLDARLPDAFDMLEQLWPANADPVRAMMEYEWRHKLVNDLLWQEDRVSMAEGLEVRVPFVDIHLRQSLAQLGSRELMPRGRTKGYMKKAIAPILPKEILRRPKSGFQVDAASFFRDHLTSLADHYLSDGRLRESGLFNPAFVDSIRRRKSAKHLRWHFFMLYLMLGTELWLESFEGTR